MNNISRSLAAVCSVTAIAAVLFFGGAQQGQAHIARAKVPYSTIEPLLKAQCLPCHNDKRHAAKVDVSNYTALMASGDDGAIVNPGHPEKSKLFTYVDGEKTPRMPMRKPALSAAQIELIKKWIKAGAKN